MLFTIVLEDGREVRRHVDQIKSRVDAVPVISEDPGPDTESFDKTEPENCTTPLTWHARSWASPRDRCFGNVEQPSIVETDSPSLSEPAVVENAEDTPTIDLNVRTGPRRSGRVKQAPNYYGHGT